MGTVSKQGKLYPHAGIVMDAESQDPTFWPWGRGGYLMGFPLLTWSRKPQLLLPFCGKPSLCSGLVQKCINNAGFYTEIGFYNSVEKKPWNQGSGWGFLFVCFVASQCDSSAKAFKDFSGAGRERGTTAFSGYHLVYWSCFGFCQCTFLFPLQHPSPLLWQGKASETVPPIGGWVEECSQVWSWSLLRCWLKASKSQKSYLTPMWTGSPDS